ncbi:hypothetical protein FSOLCH5_007665 [Fusarium solani]|nr:hypothetical protein NW759_014248 [Fusarium solani]
MNCANCGSDKRNMVACLKVPDGYLAGCILCNNLDHDTDECVVFTNMLFKDQVKLVVYQRGSLPALKIKESWSEWLRKWNRHNKALVVRLPGRFPWTGSFTVDLASRNHGHDCEELQKEYDQHKDTGRLPRDPTYGDDLGDDLDVWAALMSGHKYD